MDEQAYYNQAKALARRLWDEFQESLKEESDNLYYPKLSQDEVEIVRTVYQSYVDSGIDWLGDSIKLVWGADGLTFLACVTYARYQTRPGVGFWEGFSRWITRSDHEIDRVRDYQKLLSFFRRTSLFIAARHNRHFYVSSLYVHVRIAPKHLPRIVRVLGKIVARFPFFLDDELVQEVVGEFVHEVAGTVDSEEYSALLSDEDSDDEVSVINLTSVSSLLRYLPLSLRLASLKDPEQTTNDLVSVYQVVERVLLSDAEIDLEDVDLGEVWHLKEPFQSVLSELEESRRAENDTGRTRNPRFRRFRTPTVFFDFSKSELRLFVPEQRLDDEARDSLPITVESASYPLAATRFSLQVYTAGGVWRLTEESSVSLPRYTEDLSVSFETSNGERKSFSVGSRWSLLDSEGTPIRGTPNPGSDVYVLVERSVDFQCNGSDVEYDGSEFGFRLHHLFLEKNAVFFVDGRPVAPCLDRVPGFSIDEQYRVSDAFLTPESNHEDYIPVYREFPSFSFRTGESTEPQGDLALIIDGSRVSFDVRRDVPVADGSGDRLVEIFPFRFALQAKGDIYAGEIARVPGSSFRFAVLHNLDFAFEKRLSTDYSRPRVMSLSFDGAEQAFTKFYEFPSKSDTTRFRIKLGDADYRLHVTPHHVSWTFQDGESVSDHVSLAAIAQKELVVRYSTGSCRVVATPSDGSIATFPLTSRMNAEGVAAFPLRTLQNIRSGSIALSIIVSNPAWGKMEFERVDVCSIHTSFAFLDGPAIQLNTVGSVLSKHLPPGNYVSYKAIGDGRSQHLLSVLDSSGEPIATTEIHADGSRHESFLMELIPNGRYSIKVVRVRRLMGRTQSSEEEVFGGEPFVLRDGIPKDDNDLTGEVFRCVEAIQDALLNNGKSIRVKRPVENFYLRVTETISESPVEFLADGFFFLNGREQNHYDHNPYRLRVLERHDEKIKLRISDVHGEGVRVDRHKHVNSRSTDSQLQTHKIVVVSDMEGGSP